LNVEFNAGIVDVDDAANSYPSELILPLISTEPDSIVGPMFLKVDEPLMVNEPLITWFPTNVFEPVVAKVTFRSSCEEVNEFKELTCPSKEAVANSKLTSIASADCVNNLIAFTSVCKEDEVNSKLSNLPSAD